MFEIVAFVCADSVIWTSAEASAPSVLLIESLCLGVWIIDKTAMATSSGGLGHVTLCMLSLVHNMTDTGTASVVSVTGKSIFSLLKLHP